MDREKFHLPGKHYFLSHSVGAQPIGYDEAMTSSYTGPWRTQGAEIWNTWFEALERFKAGLAPLIGATPKDICPQPNVSSGLSKVLMSLPERAGRKKIVLTEDDFPTVGFVLAQARRLGYELVFLPGGEALADPDTWAPAFQDDVQMVLVTQVFSNTSTMTPCAEIARRAKERGVITMFDIAQSAGTVPIMLNDWGADFAVGTSLKYLCGGTGAAYLWAAQSTAEHSAPMDVGWFSHAQPFEFDIHNFEYADGAARFTGGTPSIAPFAGACASHELLNRRGIPLIYEHNQALLSRLIDGLPNDAILSNTQEGARGSAALINVKDYDAAAALLREAGIMHDTRQDAVRISIHLYNDESDIDALLSVVSDCV